jgi:hypothetical protein
MLFVVLALLGGTAVLPAAAEISDPSAGQRRLGVRGVHAHRSRERISKTYVVEAD